MTRNGQLTRVTCDEVTSLKIHTLVVSFYKMICYTIWIHVVPITIRAKYCYKNILNNCRKLPRMYSKNAFGVLNGDIKGQFVLKK